jgi:hypothetical protein
MALEMNDLMALKSLGGESLSPYEQIKLDHMQAKSHTGGVAIAGLTVASVAAVAGITAWIFGPPELMREYIQKRETSTRMPPFFLFISHHPALALASEW